MKIYSNTNILQKNNAFKCIDILYQKISNSFFKCAIYRIYEYKLKEIHSFSFISSKECFYYEKGKERKKHVVKSSYWEIHSFMPIWTFMWLWYRNSICFMYCYLINQLRGTQIVPSLERYHYRSTRFLCFSLIIFIHDRVSPLQFWLSDIICVIKLDWNITKRDWHKWKCRYCWEPKPNANYSAAIVHLSCYI